MWRLLFVLSAVVLLAPGFAADRLPAFGARIEGTTVSGLSSGGYMAVQFHIAHSKVVQGAGVLAAGPYRCAQGSGYAALMNCMKPTWFTPAPDVATLAAETEALAAARQIDATENLRRAKVWLFTGTRDNTVDPVVVQALAAFYRHYLPAGAVTIVSDVPAGHAMVTEDSGNACDVTEPPFINDCDFDAAGELLAHVAGPLEPPAAKPGDRLMAFDQGDFAGGNAYRISMGERGFVYVPDHCENTGCRVHIAFHGCRQGVDAIGERFIRQAGYQRWADTNHMIVLYPQAIARGAWGEGWWSGHYLFNPTGCWDWWGYSGSTYATQAGPQIQAVKAMLDRLAAPRRAPGD